MHHLASHQEKNLSLTHLHLHQLEWIILDTVFAGVERHYGDERFFAVELIFVAALIFSIRWLRDAKPLISES